MTSTADLSSKKNATAGGACLFLEKMPNGIAKITINLPDTKVNTLGNKSMNELNALIDQIAGDNSIKGLIITSGKDDNFIVGADVHEIKAIQQQSSIVAYEASQMGKGVFLKLDKLNMPVVAAINGLCLGGGTELALACDYRLIAPKAKIGLPEVNLGFVPGWGACVRMPKLVGLQKSLELIMGAKVLDAKKAWKAGVVDEVVDADRLMDRAIEVASGAQPKRFARDFKTNIAAMLLETNQFGRKLVYDAAYGGMMRLTKGKYPAPKEALKLIMKVGQIPDEKAYDLESQAFAHLANTDVSRNLVGIWNSQTESKKLPAAITQKPNIQTVGVLGAGVMGAGIAQACANAGYKVIVKDVEQKFLDKGKDTINGLFGKLVERKKMTKEDADKTVNSMVFTTSYDEMRDCDIVVEAVLEDIKIKQDALAALDKVIQKKYVFATNTSSLSVDKIAEGTSDPSKVVGLHFFNPVHKMPLVEVVRGAKTSDEALAAAMSVALKLDKTTVITKDAPGFVVNRILAPYLREAAVLAEEGVPIRDIDKAIKNFGMPMGPLTLLDEIGLDVAAKVIHVMHDALGERMAEPNLMNTIQSMKLLGKKGKKGIYLYDENGKQIKDPETKNKESIVNPEIQSAITAPVNKKTPGDIQDRLVLLMVNEAARCMEEGIVNEPSQLDLAMIFGTGFPPFLGGVLKYADSAGITTIYEKLDFLSRVEGERYAPCALLKQMAETRKTFYTKPKIASAV